MHTHTHTRRHTHTHTHTHTLKHTHPYTHSAIEQRSINKNVFGILHKLIDRPGIFLPLPLCLTTHTPPTHFPKASTHALTHTHNSRWRILISDQAFRVFCRGTGSRYLAVTIMAMPSTNEKHALKKKPFLLTHYELQLPRRHCCEV